MKRWVVFVLLSSCGIGYLSSNSFISGIIGQSKIAIPSDIPSARGFTQEEFWGLVAAFRLARHQYISRPSCRGLFMKVGADSSRVLTAFDFVIFVRKYKLAEKICNEGKFTAFTFDNSGIIAICQDFFQNDEVTRAVTVLHEVWHVVGGKHDASREASIAVSEAVISNCFVDDSTGDQWNRP